jgi:hypothetical protein
LISLCCQKFLTRLLRHLHHLAYILFDGINLLVLIVHKYSKICEDLLDICKCRSAQHTRSERSTVLSGAKTAERCGDEKVRQIYDTRHTIDRLFHVGHLLVPSFDFCLIIIETVGLQLLLRVHLATTARPNRRTIW